MKRLVPSEIYGKWWVAGMGFEMTQEKQTGVRIDPALKKQIDENLKRVYQDVLQEDVPDRFKDLLERLRAQESEK
ncbi:MAG: NepR family anti-sigma factor [Rhodobacterales bacterium]